MLRRTYQDAVNALNSLQSNFASIEASRKTGVLRNPQLIPEMVEWVRRAGYKPSDFNKLNIVHVTGTKGKGSTCSFVESILEQYKRPSVMGSGGPNITKIGLYTSPHLKDVRDRIRIDGQPISEEVFAKYFFEIWDKLESTESDITRFPSMGPGAKPMYFRYLTLLSFHAFMREGVDSAIYEVGIGGEYDSTNIIEKPTACGITSLGLDHTAILGNTLESIAWNKSGIFKQGTPCFSVHQPDEAAEKMIISRATEKGAASFEWVDTRKDLESVKLGINGDFQAQNASMAVDLARAHLQGLGFEIPPASLPAKFVQGLEKASWAGRCQILPDHEEGLTWFIDGAHTHESIESATHWFTTVTEPDHTRVLLFNQQTRDTGSLLTTVHEKMQAAGLRFDHVVFTTNVTWTSGYQVDQVSINTDASQVDSLAVQTHCAQKWDELDKKSRKHIFPDIETSVNYIRSIERPLDVFVVGSLHLVGGFLVVFDQ